MYHIEEATFLYRERTKKSTFSRQAQMVIHSSIHSKFII